MSDDNDPTRFRLGIVALVVAGLFSSLFVRLWFLQAIEQGEAVADVTANFRTIRTEGARGRILDRSGRVIVDNRTSIVAGLFKPELDDLSAEDRQEVLRKLAASLASFDVPVKVEELNATYADGATFDQFDVRPIATDISEEAELFLLERAGEFPGLRVERRSVRFYPYGSAAAHLVGYVGEINNEELAERSAGRRPEGPPEGEIVAVAEQPDAFPAKPYRRGSMIGKAGVERAYEYYLRGVPGERVVQADANGRYVRLVRDRPAQPGLDVWLSIDLDVQLLAERELTAQLERLRGGTTKDGKRRKGEQGSVVLVNPADGTLTAMASAPTYDPTDFVNGLTREQLAELTDDDAGRPFNNWAIQGAYAPGSTFKPVTALAGYRSGFISPGNDTYVDTGTYQVRGCADGGKGCNPRNAGEDAHGLVDVERSLTVSSDTYYYRIGDNLWADRDRYGETVIQDVAGELGLGAGTGIVLPGEVAGRIPTPAARRAAYEANPDAFLTSKWSSGDNVNIAVGQGDVLVTPLQLANLYATFANGGTRWTPQVAVFVTKPKLLSSAPNTPDNFTVMLQLRAKKAGTFAFDGVQYQEIYRGLLGVTEAGAEGTASAAFTAVPPDWPVAGKTGTAQVQGRNRQFKADTALFAGFGPAAFGTPASTVAFSAILPEAGFGGEAAAPLIAAIVGPIAAGSVPKAVPVRGFAPSELRRQRQQATEGAKTSATDSGGETPTDGSTPSTAGESEG